MKLAKPYSDSTVKDIEGALDGGTLVLYSVARPASPDHAVERSGVLATFTFAAPAFCSADSVGTTKPSFAANPVIATGTGTPGFARAFKADGSAVADLSVGPGDTEVKLSEVSTTPSYPVTLTTLTFCMAQN
jgi:hypothetical protein